MSQSAQIILGAPNPFTVNPSITYFKTSYEPQDSPLGESFEIPFDNQQVRFGTTSECTIPAYGDLLTSTFLRTTLPAIYPPQTGAYVYPQTSTSFSGALLVQKGLTFVTADGSNLTANTVGSHFFSVGAEVILTGTAYSFFNLDGVYTITSIPTANSFVCSSSLAGISYNGTVSTVGIQSAPVVGYYSTQNLNLWAEVPVNLTYNSIGGQITVQNASLVPGQTINVFKSLANLSGQYTVATSSGNVFTLVNTSLTVPLFVSRVTSGTPPYSMLSYDGINWASGLGEGLDSSGDRVAYGNGIFVTIIYDPQTDSYFSLTSTDGNIWTQSPQSMPYPGFRWMNLTYGNGYFVAIDPDSLFLITSSDGNNWTSNYSIPNGYNWSSLSYANGLFMAGGYGTYYMMTATDPTGTWAGVVVPVGLWSAATYGNGLFVAVNSGTSSPSVITSTDGVSWTPNNSAPHPNPSYGGNWFSVTYGNGVFVATGYGEEGYPGAMTATNPTGTWTVRAMPREGKWTVVYANGLFVAVNSYIDYFQELHFPAAAYSTDGVQWDTNPTTPENQWGLPAVKPDALNELNLFENSITVTYDPNQSRFIFSSVVYPSITFANAQDAAFWGFDYLQGPSFPFVNGQLTSQWTLTQGGWVQGFLPPTLSNYDDSVAHKLVKEARVLVGRQVIKRFTGEYLELINDLTIPYENKAILKLMNGTLDFTQAVASREYYVNIPLGCESIPLCALTRQQMSIEIDFEEYRNLSNDLNPGTGDFFDQASYLTYNVSQNLLGGQTFNVVGTLSYQNYILILTTNGTFIVYDTTKPIDDPGSYQVITAFTGQTSGFVNFVILGNILYIQLLNGYVIGGNLDELIQGNTSSFASNNYLPMSVSDAGPPTGTMVCDARYLYYAQTNVASNVFFVRYDTRTPFQELGGYESFNFTSEISANTSSVYQLLSTGNELIALTNTPGTFYTFPIVGDFLTEWIPISFGYGQATESVVIGLDVYLLVSSSCIVKYSDRQFTEYDFYERFVSVVNNSLYDTPLNQTISSITSPDGTTWRPATLSRLEWNSVVYINGQFVTVSSNEFTTSDVNLLIPSVSILKTGNIWRDNYNTPSSHWGALTYGNGFFVAVSRTFPYVMTATDPSGPWTLNTSITAVGGLASVAYGNGFFVALPWYSSDQGLYLLTATDPTGPWTENTLAPSISFGESLTYGNGIFVAEILDYNQGSQAILTATDPTGTWNEVLDYRGRITYCNGFFIGLSGDYAPVDTSTDGINWTPNFSAPYGSWTSIAYGNGLYVASGSGYNYMTATDPTGTWTIQTVPIQGSSSIAYGGLIPYLGPIKNLHAVGSTIYASANTASQTSIIQIDTTKDLSTVGAYQYYSSSGTPPISFAGNVPSIFANGPRYLYIFTNDPSQTTSPTNAIRYDPYPVNPTLQASIIADYKILPPGVPKPTWAEIKYVQNQHVTADNFADLQILGPVKELIVTGAASAANVFQYSNLDGAVSLTITGNEEILTPDVGTVTGLGVMAPFQTHTVLPVRNLSVIPFEVNPESLEPNGTINFSRLQYQNLSNGSSVWASSYNILRIESGVGGLKFNSPY